MLAVDCWWWQCVYPFCTHHQWSYMPYLLFALNGRSSGYVLAIRPPTHSFNYTSWIVFAFIWFVCSKHKYFSFTLRGIEMSTQPVHQLVKCYKWHNFHLLFTSGHLLFYSASIRAPMLLSLSTTFTLSQAKLEALPLKLPKSPRHLTRIFLFNYRPSADVRKWVSR